MNHAPQIPDPAVRRLSLYPRQLEALEADRVATVSSRKLAQPLGLTDAQVRRDLAYFGQFGRSGVGYEVTALIHRLRSILGTDRISQALLVGAGNIGRALVAYQGFRTRGFELVAVFDTDPDMVGQQVAHLFIQPMEELAGTAKQHRARLAIVAVPAAAAQDVADRLIAAGIRGILNFAPTRLDTHPGVTVSNIDVAAELEQINFTTSIGAPAIPATKEVLIVDDSEANVVFLSQIVEDNGHRFRVARNGKEATRAVRESRPDLILLDLVMPRKGGIKVLQEMKDDPVLKEIPIIVTTGASDVTGVDIRTGEALPSGSYGDDAARRLGTVLYEKLKGLTPDGFIEKPIDPELLSSKMRELLS